MRHTSGLTYGLLRRSEGAKARRGRGHWQPEKTVAEHAEALAALPLMHQPGEIWEYSFSTDVLGRVVEVVEGGKLGDILRTRIFEPLGMDDTAFFIPPAKLARHAKPMSPQVYANLGVDPKPTTEPPRFESGGSGLMSTIGDYARFCAMLSRGGELDGQRILAPRTLRFMASDHLGPDVDRSSEVLPPGHGFGLGFGVRLQSGVAPTPGSVGDYFWGGWAGTTFRISPQELAVRDPHGAGARLSSPSKPDVRESLQRGDSLSLRLSPTPHRYQNPSKMRAKANIRPFRPGAASR